MHMENTSFRFVEALVTEGAACSSPRDKMQRGRSVRHLRRERSDLRGRFYRYLSWKELRSPGGIMDVRSGCST